MATNTRSQQPQAEGISGVILQDLELLRWRDLHTSTHPAPSRRPQPPGSCLRVLRCVAYCPLSLDSPAPSPIGQNEHLGHCRPARRSGGRAALRCRYSPTPTHACGPLQPSNPIVFGLSTHQAADSQVRSSEDEIAEVSSRSRTSPLGPSSTVVETPGMQEIPSRAGMPRAPEASPKPHVAM